MRAAGRRLRTLATRRDRRIAYVTLASLAYLSAWAVLRWG